MVSILWIVSKSGCGRKFASPWGALTVESYFSINGSIRIDEGLLVFNKAISRDRGTLAGISGVMTAMYCDNASLGTDSFTILARAKTQKQDKTVLFSYQAVYLDCLELTRD